MAQLYPRWKDAAEVRRTLDPQGRMLNPYLKGIFLDG
ncbi:MAG: D-arabinono-1,4-lactone oxidase [Novosphingobium sp.]